VRCIIRIFKNKTLTNPADLTELGRTPVAVISSGCKSFLDIPRTLEYLETEGVCVGTFADGRQGSVDFPAFFTRDSGIKSPKVIQDEAEAAAIICMPRLLDYTTSANPIRCSIQAPPLLGNALCKPRAS
jgi:pseudouridine-5'-phosphate glycosidase/pseudouridine kinase